MSHVSGVSRFVSFVSNSNANKGLLECYFLGKRSAEHATEYIEGYRKIIRSSGSFNNFDLGLTISLDSEDNR